MLTESFLEGLTLAQVLNNGLASAIVIAFIVWAFKFTGPLIKAWTEFTSAIQSIQGNCSAIQTDHRQEFDELKEIATVTLRTVERIDTSIPLIAKGGK